MGRPWSAMSAASTALSSTVIGDTVNTASRLQGLTRTLETPLVVGDPLVTAVTRGPSGAAAVLAGQLQDYGEHALRGPRRRRPYLTREPASGAITHQAAYPQRSVSIDLLDELKEIAAPAARRR
jgi:class 3 adenylate cyclase